MKATLFFTLLILASFVAPAQDTLIKRNGDTLLVKLTEVNPYDIRYTLPTYPDGPVFNLLKEYLKEIHYGNGYRESFESYIPPYKAGNPDADLSILTSGKHFYYKEHRITERDMLGIVARQDDRKLNRMIRRIEGLKLAQTIGVCVSIPLFVSGAYLYRANSGVQRRRGGYGVGAANNPQLRKNGIILMLCSALSGVLSVSFYIDRRRNDRFLVNAYNNTIYKH